jgi:CheY-like chemotaxis protein/HPt (histidine-containing phosphotransfer) domain-containing protein
VETLAPAHVGDPLRLRQILSNLLSNAIKFTEVGGIEVAVRVADESPAAQTVEIAVSDTGIGVTPEQQSSLFEEFSQAGVETTRRFGGTGLGLVICKRLAVLMGGDVTMQSTPGTGTTMRLTVPLPLGEPSEVEAFTATATSALATSRPKPGRDEAEREGSLLLLAEDHPVNAAVLCHQLDLIGFHVDVAADGAEAYERFLAGGYALVLTDLNMPRMDGFDLARAIRARETETAADRTPIIALTASVMQGEPELCSAAGMDDFVAKPTTIPFLAGRLQSWLAHLEWPEPDESSAQGSASCDVVADAVIDASVLSELTGGDAAIAAAVLDDFVATTRTDADALERALASHNLEQIRREAHRIQGAARSVGVQRITAAAMQIESRAARGSADWAAFDALVAQLRDALDDVMEAVAR